MASATWRNDPGWPTTLFTFPRGVQLPSECRFACQIVPFKPKTSEVRAPRCRSGPIIATASPWNPMNPPGFPSTLFRLVHGTQEPSLWRMVCQRVWPPPNAPTVCPMRCIPSTLPAMCASARTYVAHDAVDIARRRPHTVVKSDGVPNYAIDVRRH
jgi:hypothetical protein